MFYKVEELQQGALNQERVALVEQIQAGLPKSQIVGIDFANWEQRNGCSKYSASKIFNQCYDDVTFLEATMYCMMGHGRLCTKDELEADCTRSSGCSLDSQYVWSSTPQNDCTSTFQGQVDAFFDEVMVMVDEPDLRANRLGLLKSLRDLFLRIADISLLAVTK